MAKEYLSIENGIFMKGPISNFQLMYKDKTLTPHCSCLGYIKGTLIAVKCDKVIVYRPEVEIVDGTTSLIKIAEFYTQTPGVYLKVTIGEKTYIIDSNVQISYCNCIKLH